ncbi:hypothetical protein O3M35_009787 [Rhynocoris fuscipes]|uniref:Odorant receptor n=1 Tax=Rhynocoris fuscipes TaxID=488301 RepID=A0AAW1D456_9HEMI
MEVVCDINSPVISEKWLMSSGGMIRDNKRNIFPYFWIPADISPYRLLYYSLRSGGFMISDGKPWSLIYSAIHIFLILSLAILSDVIIGNENIDRTVMAMSFFAVSVQLYTKLIVTTSNENKIRELIERLEKYRLNLLADEQYRSQIIEADNICRRVSKNFTILVLTYPFLSLISNVATDYLTNFEEPHFTVQIWLPWNVNGFWSYSAAATFELFIALSGSLIYASCGVFQFTFTYQMSAYLKVLQNRLIDNGPTNKSIYQQHNTLNQFLLDYIDIHSTNLFVEIMVASLMPCGFGYTIIKMERLHESTYMSKWYEEKPKVRRDLYTMMLVTVRPVTPNYKLFIRIDMKCGTTILKRVSPVKIAYHYLRIFGVLNYENRPWSLILAVYNFTMINVCLFGCFTYIFLNKGILVETLKAMSLLTAYIHIYGKAVNGLIKQREIAFLLKRMEELRMDILKDEKNQIFVTKADNFLFKFIIGYNMLLISYPFILTISDFLKYYRSDFKDPHQAIQVWIPWKIDEFWPYIGGMSYEILFTITSAGYYGSFTTLQFIFAFQTSAFLQALQHQLETYGPKNKYIYKQHASIIQLIQKYNDLFSGQMFLEIMVSSFQPCGYGFALIKALRNNDPAALPLIVTTSIATTTSFIVCFCGQEISTQVARGIYSFFSMIANFTTD